MSRAVPRIAFFVLGALLAAGRAPAGELVLTLGVESRVLPSYPGSSNSVLLPIPLVNVRPVGVPRHFANPREGLGIGLYDNGYFRAGLTAKAELPRREKSDPALAGLGNVGWAIEPGAFLEFWPLEWLRTRGELRQGLGGHQGQVGDLSADAVFAVTPKLTLSGGPRVSFATEQALQPYFGITAAQAAASIYPAYDVSGGLKSFGLGALARYELSSQWATHFFVEYERLAGSPADSPLVTMRGSRDQVQIGIGITYSFNTSVPF
jgi:outer membrane protein